MNKERTFWKTKGKFGEHQENIRKCKGKQQKHTNKLVGKHKESIGTHKEHSWEHTEEWDTAQNTLENTRKT